MKVVYIAGPYRAASEWQVLENIRRAEAVAIQVWRMGAACICPHKNTAFFGGAADDRVWLEGDLEMVRRSDAIMVTDNWQVSEGARGEVELARKLGKRSYSLRLTEVGKSLLSASTEEEIVVSPLPAAGTDRHLK